jgi:hypothetical protein
MILYIDDYKSVSDLQEKFTECFPCLKIEFYDKWHHYQKPSSPKHLISAHKMIGDIRTKHEHGDLSIKSWSTVGNVERDFKHKFGLNVQIFRKDHNNWIQTSARDNFTLKEESDMSMHAANERGSSINLGIHQYSAA